MRLLALILFSLLLAVPAAAADAPVFAPAPDWVVPVEAPAMQTAATEGQALASRLSDFQWRQDEGGIHAYAHTVIKIASPEALASAGNLRVQWHPGTQTMTVHRIAIHRGSEVIDVLAQGSRFTVMRREGALESSIVDGLLTANLQVPDLRVGDVVEIALTVTERNPAMAGHSQYLMPVVAPFTTDRFHFTASWPSTGRTRWRAGEAFPEARETRRNGFTTVTVDRPAFAAAVYPDGAPGRFVDTFAIQISDFESWSEVSAMFAEVYAAATRLGERSPLRAEASRIAAASQDPLRRAEAALALVQNQVRYVFDGTGLGGYVPQSADQVWASRYGDCKGKTVLLIALLRELGIEAEPALVSMSRGDGVDGALPMPGRFDHAIARVRIGGRTYWLDGTRTGDTSLDRIAVPPVQWALPLTSGGSDLEQLALVTPAQPTSELSVEYDLRGGITLPATVRAQFVLRGDSAVGLQRILEFMPAAERQAAVRNYWAENFSNFEVQQADYSLDPERGEARYSMSGTGTLSWDLWGQNATRRLELGRVRLGLDLAPQRRPGPWAEAPVAIAGQHYLTRYVVLLPNDGEDFIIEGDPVDETIGPARYRRTARISRGRLEAEAVTQVQAGEISYAQAQSDDRANDAVLARRLFVRAPLNYQLTDAERAAAANSSGTPTAAMAEMDVLRSITRSVESGDAAGAVAQATAEMDRSGRSANLLVVRSELQWELRNREAAEADLDAALALQPNHPPGLMLRASRLAEQSRYEDASMILDRLVLAEPRYSTAYLQRSRIRAAMNRLDAALGDLDIVIQLEPENREAWIARANIHTGRGDEQKALEAAEGLLRLFPDDDTAHALHGNILARMGRREEAIAALARSLQIEESADAYITRAHFDLSGDVQARLRDLLAAIRLDPTRPLPTDALRAVLEVDGAYQQLEAAYESRRREIPRPERMRLALGSLYAAAGRREQAIAMLDEEIAAEPGSASLLNNRCWQRATWGMELDRALADCEAAVALSGSASHLDSRGLVHLRRGDFEAAIADYSAALALRPRLSHSLYGRGLAKLRQGNRAAGEADLTAARQIQDDIGDEFRRYGLEP